MHDLDGFWQYLHRLTLLILLCLGAPLLASGETPGQTLPQEALAQARAFETAKQYDQAIASYRTYLALRPDDNEARGALARVLSWQGYYDEAVALYEDIRTRHPDDFDVLAALARVKSWQKRFAEARSLYDKVLEAYPQYLEARRGLADTLYWSGDYAAALPQYETVFSMTADPEVAQRIQAIKAALSHEAAPQESVTQEAGPHAPGRHRAATGVSLPYRDYLKLGYSRFAYTRGIADEQNGLVEVARSLGTRTLVGRLELVDRFGFLDAALSGELYSPLWTKAWGYVSAFAGIDPHVVAQWKVGGEVSQGLGILHPALAFLEPSLGYSRMSFRTTNVNLLTPGLTVYLPYNVWLTERVSYTPEARAATLSSQLTWRVTNQLQLFAAGAFGTFGERATSSQDFRRISTHSVQGGLTFPLAPGLAAEVSGYYEDRKALYVLRGATGKLIVHW